MKLYKVVIGYVQLKFPEEGDFLDNGLKFPISPCNIIVDSPEVAKYLLEQLDLKHYKLELQTEAPVYLEHELN